MTGSSADHAKALRAQIARYDRAAPSWSATLRRLGVGEAYRRFARTLGPIRGPVLDLGAGTGWFGRALAGDNDLLGVDHAPRMVARAASEARVDGRRGVWRVGSLADLPFPAESFGAVCLGHVVEHLPDPPATLAAIRRCVRPGGLVVAAVTRRGPAGAWIAWRWSVRVYGRAEVQRVFEAAGLEVVSVRPLEGGICRWLSWGVVARRPGPEVSGV